MIRLMPPQGAYDTIDNIRAEATTGTPQQATREKLPRADALKRRINEVDAEIDQIVYQLYGLTEQEIKIVEQGTRSTSALALS